MDRQNENIDRVDKTVAVFHYDFQVQTHTVNLIKYFLKKDLNVKLFLFLSPNSLQLVDLTELEKLGNFKILKFYFKKYSVANIANRLFFSKKRCNVVDSSLDLTIYRSSKFFVDKLEKYKFIVAVEKKGLIWASKISNKFNIPYYYYSLELYNKFHPIYEQKWQMVLDAEKIAYKNAEGLIVQDEDRQEILERDLEIKKEAIFIPVSVDSDKIEAASQYLQNKFNIDVPILLNIGLNSKSRKLDEILYYWNKEPDKKMVLVLHGLIEPYIKNLAENTQQVVFSDEIIGFEEQWKIVASAKIGLAIYDNFVENDRLTAFSSAKIALYCQSGIPFIAMKNENYLKLQSRFECCILIDNISEIFDAVKKIMNNYSFYRENAFKAFDGIYNFKVYLEKLDDFFL